MSIDQVIGIVFVGLKSGDPGVTLEQATELCQAYISQYGEQELENKLTDAFVDAGISDRKEVARQRELIERLRVAQEKLIEAGISKKEAEVDKLAAEVSGTLKLLGEPETETETSSVTGEGSRGSGDGSDETRADENPLENPI